MTTRPAIGAKVTAKKFTDVRGIIHWCEEMTPCIGKEGVIIQHWDSMNYIARVDFGLERGSKRITWWWHISGLELEGEDDWGE